MVAQQLGPLGPGEVLLRKLSDNTVLTRLGDKIELTVASHDAQATAGSSRPNFLDHLPVRGARLPELSSSTNVRELWYFPQVINEALCVGFPIVATAVGEVPSVLVDGETALLVVPADAEALARGLEDSSR